MVQHSQALSLALNNATANELVTVGATTTELDAEANLTFDGTTLTVTGNITVPNDGDMALWEQLMRYKYLLPVITFKDDILIKDGNIGSASAMMRCRLHQLVL